MKKGKLSGFNSCMVQLKCGSETNADEGYLQF